MFNFVPVVVVNYSSVVDENDTNHVHDLHVLLELLVLVSFLNVVIMLVDFVLLRAVGNVS